LYGNDLSKTFALAKLTITFSLLQSSDTNYTTRYTPKWNIVFTCIINTSFCKTGQDICWFAKSNAICNMKYINTFWKMLSL